MRMGYPPAMMRGMFAAPQMQMPIPKYYSIDVECVATGTGHNDRAVGQIALVDQYERVILNLYVRCPVPVVSYLTPLTGLTAELVESQGISLQEAMTALRQNLPPFATLVGQNIAADIRWLGLQEGVDFEGLIDLSGAFRVFNPKFNGYSYFSLAHEARVLLGISMESVHNAATDAIISIRLFNKFMQLRDTPELETVKQSLIAIPLEPSFAKKNPSYETVCMGNKKTCTCGQQIIY